MKKKFSDMFELTDSKNVKVDKSQLMKVKGGLAKKKKWNGIDEPVELINLDLNPIEV